MELYKEIKKIRKERILLKKEVETLTKKLNKKEKEYFIKIGECRECGKKLSDDLDEFCSLCLNGSNLEE